MGKLSDSTDSQGQLRTVPMAEDHRQAWEKLYEAYAVFYKKKQTPKMRERVWNWLHDPDHELEGLLVLNASGNPVGLAHYREFARPLAASQGCYLDDLFVAPSARGAGAAEALLATLQAESKLRDWTLIRWVTAEDNYRARGLYDRVSKRTDWVVYEMVP